MKSFTDAKSAAEKSGTQKSEKFRPAARKFILGFTIIVILGAAMYYWQPSRQPSVQQAPATGASSESKGPFLASTPQSSLKLSIPAHDRSGLILPVEGKYPSVTAVGKFRVHNVRADNTECAFEEAGCVSGPLLKGYYVTNESDKRIDVTVDFK